MPKHKVGERVLVRLSGGRIVEATIKAVIETTEGGVISGSADLTTRNHNFVAEGCEFFKDDQPKLRHIGFYGDRRTKRILRAALRWEVLPYPKRAQSPEDRVQVVDLDPVPKTLAAASAP